MNRPTRYRWLLAMALLWCLPALAETVYKWVDEHEVIIFSDIRPDDGIPVETVVIHDQASPSNELAQQRLENMRETTDRMAADRMAREKHRAELRQLEAQTDAPLASQDYTGYYEDSTVYPGYYSYPAPRPWRHPHHPRPVHPIVKPPFLHPPANNLPPGVRPWPGGTFPAPHIRPLFTPKVRGSSR